MTAADRSSSPDSQTPLAPWRAIPGHLVEPRQVLGLDAVSMAARMVDLAHLRLVELLADASNPSPMVSVDCLHQAWSIVDSSHRLASLLLSTPGLKQKAAPVAAAHGVLKTAEPMRHIAQHLGREIAKTASRGGSIWGDIYWSFLDQDGHLQHSILWVGTLYGSRSEEVPAPPPDLPRTELPFFIHLVRGPEVLHLSALAAAARTLSVELEAEVYRRLGELPSSVARPTLLRLTFTD